VAARTAACATVEGRTAERWPARLRGFTGQATCSTAIAAPALAFSARRHGAEKLSRCGDRFRQQAVCFSLGGMRLVAQSPIGSPMHATRLSRKRFQRVVARAEPHLDLLRSAHCPSGLGSGGDVPLLRVITRLIAQAFSPNSPQRCAPSWRM
jgi:hypothetical protein